MPTHHPPLGSGCDPQYLADVRETAEKIVAANHANYRVAAEWLEHYLSGAAGIVPANLHWLRSNYHFPKPWIRPERRSRENSSMPFSPSWQAN